MKHLLLLGLMGQRKWFVSLKFRSLEKGVCTTETLSSEWVMAVYHRCVWVWREPCLWRWGASPRGWCPWEERRCCACDSCKKPQTINRFSRCHWDIAAAAVVETHDCWRNRRPTGNKAFLPLPVSHSFSNGYYWKNLKGYKTEEQKCGVESSICITVKTNHWQTDAYQLVPKESLEITGHKKSLIGENVYTLSHLWIHLTLITWKANFESSYISNIMYGPWSCCSCLWCQLSHCSHNSLNPGKETQGAAGTANRFLLSRLAQQP